MDGRRDDVRQAEQGQRRLVAERAERGECLQRVQLVARVDWPMGQAVQTMTDTFSRAVLGAPRQRPPADPVLSSLRGREVAVLGGGRREEIFP